MINDEQIQALLLIATAAQAAPDWYPVGSYGDVVSIDDPKWSAVAEFVKTFNAQTVREILAAWEADHALIAKLQRANAAQDDHINQQADRIESLEKTNHGLGKRLCAVEARTLTVKFNPIPMEDLGNKNQGKKHPYMFGAGYNSAVVICECTLKKACAEQGFTLVVGGE